MDRLMPTDELSVLKEELDSDWQDPNRKKERKEDRIDEILDMLIVAYVFGNEAANTMLESDIQVDVDTLNESVYKRIADKNWEERVREYYDSDTATVADIMRVVETDTHRIYNDSILNVGEKVANTGKAVTKTWQTMLDDRVRDTHDYIEGVTVPVDSRFYTFDGDSARYPGDFTAPENNINCRCRIVLK